VRMLSGSEAGGTGACDKPSPAVTACVECDCEICPVDWSLASSHYTVNPSISMRFHGGVSRLITDRRPNHTATPPLMHSAETRRLIDSLGFNGTFCTNRLYRAFEKYGAVKKSEISEKGDNVTCWEFTYNKP